MPPKRRAIQRRAITVPAGKAHRRVKARSGEKTKRATAVEERIAARRLKAFGLRCQGCSFPEIARRLSCSVGTAYEDVTAELFDIRTKTKEDVERVRDMEVERCDRVIQTQWARAAKGDARSATAIVKAMDHKAKLLGLYAAQKVDLEGGLTLDVFADARKHIESSLGRLAERAGAATVPGQPGTE